MNVFEITAMLSVASIDDRQPVKIWLLELLDSKRSDVIKVLSAVSTQLEPSEVYEVLHKAMEKNWSYKVIARLVQALTPFCLSIDQVRLLLRKLVCSEIENARNLELKSEFVGKLSEYDWIYKAILDHAAPKELSAQFVSLCGKIPLTYSYIRWKPSGIAKDFWEQELGALVDDFGEVEESEILPAWQLHCVHVLEAIARNQMIPVTDEILRYLIVHFDECRIHAAKEIILRADPMLITPEMVRLAIAAGSPYVYFFLDHAKHIVVDADLLQWAMKPIHEGYAKCRMCTLTIRAPKGAVTPELVKCAFKTFNQEASLSHIVALFQKKIRDSDVVEAIFLFGGYSVFWRIPNIEECIEQELDLLLQKNKNILIEQSQQLISFVQQSAADEKFSKLLQLKSSQAY